jgi:hypothetical protein
MRAIERRPPVIPGGSRSPVCPHRCVAAASTCAGASARSSPTCSAIPPSKTLDLTPEQVSLADELRVTRDPFDALIVAAAQTLGLPLVTCDSAIRESGAVRAIW